MQKGARALRPGRKLRRLKALRTMLVEKLKLNYKLYQNKSVRKTLEIGMPTTTSWPSTETRVFRAGSSSRIGVTFIRLPRRILLVENTQTPSLKQEANGLIDVGGSRLNIRENFCFSSRNRLYILVKLKSNDYAILGRG
ncbi:MAG: hypothetical protein B9J98_01700 [Candidatus Terraquivivens tikiterensis]|uniref:Uncharacterized protein n=1 Tax=Candidatus Terraquivivens tikiterensis TaxID=1980982 RepID=A0A2R7Y997_9ARCH|nr:MAG: hypothetical protein B9J98_01700 [Candidatus Terraquivivens tikiterensis]